MGYWTSAGRRLCLLLTALSACDDPTAGRSEQEPVRVSLGVVTPRMAEMVGATLETPVRFLATDAKGQPLPGVKLEFATSAGASLAPLAQATGTDGTLDVIFTLGATPGEYSIDARVPGGTATARYTALASTLRLDLDTAVVALPDCERTITAKTFDNKTEYTPYKYASPVNYVLTDTGIVKMVIPTYHGMPLPQQRRLFPVAPGVTRIIAEYKGSTDTAVVRVYGKGDLTPLKIELGPRSIAVPVGAKTPHSMSIGAVVRGEGDCRVPDAVPTLSVADPSVATLGKEGWSSSWFLRGVAPGDTRVEAQYGNLSASVPVIARHVRVAPADTTIRVGQSFEYRLFTADASRSWVEVPGAYVHAFGPAAQRRAGTALVTGVAPGKSEIIVWAGPWEMNVWVTVVQ